MLLPVARMTLYLDNDINEADQLIIMSQTFGVVFRVTQSPSIPYGDQSIFCSLKYDAASGHSSNLVIYHLVQRQVFGEELLLAGIMTM